MSPTGAQIDSGRITSSTGCKLDYRIYDADTEDRSSLVVLAHGFLRSQERMQALAEAIAASGIPVVTLDFCNSRIWNGRHAQNGLDMVALAHALDAKRVIYAGFSAGGLAAVIAGRADAKAIGIITLDLVETQGLGIRAAAGIDKPLLAIAGEPTNCNALGNGQAVFAATENARIQRIESAGHCDFEAPTDVLCELICSDPDSDAPSLPIPSQRERIIASTTLAIHALLEDNLQAWPDQ
ncbi:MAG: hypothetical protein N838_00655 [Thiohalocapsa sp. PB-PSB1]|jgi:pimeloyl-ACP methyl ester carboxylesterase|nr:MAG: hypothetical protein N838_00655 [Thiohalocapsa sp. PB-PSB1]